MANQLLINLGPFEKIELSTDPQYVKPSTAQAATNADVITQKGALLTVLGRSIIATLALPAGNTIVALGRYQTFEGKTNDTPFNRRFYIFSAFDGVSTYTQGAYEIGTGDFSTFPNLRPFTACIQYEDTFYTNAGQQVRRRPWGSGGWLVDEWQIAPPPNILGAVRSATNADSPGDGTYNYAFGWKTSATDGDPTIVQSSSPFYLETAVNITAGSSATGLLTVSISGGGSTAAAGDQVTLHVDSHTASAVASGSESVAQLTIDLANDALANPSIAALVNVVPNSPASGLLALTAITPGTSGNAIAYKGSSSPGGAGHAIVTPTVNTNMTGGTQGQAPKITLPTSAVLATSYGGQTVEAYLYRESSLQPLYLEVGAIHTLQTVSAGGYTTITDVAPDTTIAGNTPLVSDSTGSDHHDPPPFATQLVQTNTSGVTTSQTTWYVENPGFMEVHKGRLWCFTLYPNVYNLKTNNGGTYPTFNALKEVQLQSQLWYSDFGVGWSFDNVDGVQTVGDETTPGNSDWNPAFADPPQQNVPEPAGWDYGINVDDIPKGLKKAGSYLCALKSQTFDIITGDDPTTFRVYETFNVGCLSSNSVDKGEGGIFWLAPPYHVYFFAGGEPIYIGEDIRKALEALPQNVLANALGFYTRRTYNIIFNNNGVYQGYEYYVPDQKWMPINFGPTAVFSTPELAVVGNESAQLSHWDAGAQDIGSSISASWTSGLSDSGAPGQQKRFRYVVLDAPLQAGVTATIQVSIDPTSTLGTVWNSPTIDLGKGPGSWALSLPQAFIGYMAQVTVTLTNTASNPNQAVLRRVNVYGDVAHDLHDNQRQWLT